MQPTIKLLKTSDDAVLPTANNKEPLTGDTGFDLVAVEDVYISAGSSKVVPVGLTLADITPGYWIKIEPRSGLGFKKSLQPHLGVIDNGYRGDLAVKMYNFHESTDIAIEKGDKIAQLVVYRLIQPNFEFSTEITETSRGKRGFGSSDQPITRNSESSCSNSTTLSASYNGSMHTPPHYDDCHSREIYHRDYIRVPKLDEGESIDPWEFSAVDELLRWARQRTDISDAVFEQMVRKTLKNQRAKSKHV